jgi:hypothetical protein
MSRLTLGALATAALMIAASAPLVAAHAVLTKTSVNLEAVPADAATSIVLSFNSRIEPAFTTAVLVDADRHERPLATRPREAPGEVAVELPPLSTGRYALRYRVLAADGHVTEAMLRFRVVPAD